MTPADPGPKPAPDDVVMLLSLAVLAAIGLMMAALLTKLY